MRTDGCRLTESCSLPAGGAVPSNFHGPGPRSSRSQAIGQQHDGWRLAPSPELPPGTRLLGWVAGDGHLGNTREREQRFPGVADDWRAPQVTQEGALWECVNYTRANNSLMICGAKLCQYVYLIQPNAFQESRSCSCKCCRLSSVGQRLNHHCVASFSDR